jgi:SAM-dependent methyltransferase
MNPWNTLDRTVKKIKRDGIKKTLKASFSHIYDLYFDWKYNVDTVTWVSQEDLIKENNISKYSGHYQGTNACLIKSLFKRLNYAKDRAFVDLGSGKGRVLLLAQDYGFLSIKGIELSQKLCDISRKNIESFNAKTDLTSRIALLNIDATTYKFDKKDSILFMYNPFNGVVFEKVVQNLKHSLEDYPRKMTIIYMNPTETDILESNLVFSSIENYTWNEDYIIYTIN